jgi:hypothetical protein
MSVAERTGSAYDLGPGFRFGGFPGRGLSFCFG